MYRETVDAQLSIATERFK